MDTASGALFGSFKEALESGARKEDVLEFDIDVLENNKLLVGTLKFLLNDNAFSTDFLLTTIFTYMENEAKQNKPPAQVD